MLSDLRFALRSLTRSPGFTAVAITTLAIAIGVNTAIFSLINGLILRPVVPHKPEEVVNIFTARKGASRDYRQFSHAEFSALREANPVFGDVAAINFSLAGVGRDETVRRSFVFLVSENFFSLVGVRPATGRFFNKAEAQPNAGIPVAVASYSFWQRTGARADFVGSTIQVNGQAFTIIGVTHDGAVGVNAMMAPDLWLPLGVYSQLTNPVADNGPNNNLSRPTNYALTLIGRFKPGVDQQSAFSLLPTLARRLNALQPPEAATASERELQIQPPSRMGISTEPANEAGVTSLATLLIGMAAIVLLIACLNLANMFLARGTARAKEIAIRLSLGASRWCIIRQLLTEGLLLALCGGSLGLLLSQWSNDLLAASLNSAFQAMNYDLTLQFTPDATVLAATLVFCLGATLVFSLGPAVHSVRIDLVHDLKQQGGEPATAGKWNRFFSARSCLVMAQIALSLVLLFSGGLFFRGALNAANLDLGFNPIGTAIAEFDFSLTRIPEATARKQMMSLLNRVQQMPGVDSAAFTTLLPYSGAFNSRRVVPAEAKTEPGKTDQQAGVGGAFSAITADYFDAVGIKLLRGRKFTSVEAENSQAPSVVIIDERMAKALFPAGDALGRQIRYSSAPPGGTPKEMEIVGIVSNHRQRARRGDAEAHLYVPLTQAYNSNVFLATRFAGANSKTTPAATSGLRKSFRSLDPDLPLLRLSPYANVVDGSLDLWMIRAGAVMFGTFGGIALLLAIVGVYGVKAYAVSRRTREIGIRMALGALPKNVFSLIMKQGALQIAVSAAAGVALSLLVGKALASVLFNVSPSDPIVLGVSISLLAAFTMLACFLPARRATHVNPTEALRAE